MKYKIYLDFDGTVVEHAYPKIGAPNEGAVRVLNKLHDAGHEIILNTMRANMHDGSLEEAIAYIENEFKPIPFVKEKLHPDNWNKAFKSEILYIDDISDNIPLRKNNVIPGYMVDWEALDKHFINNGLYN